MPLPPSLMADPFWAHLANNWKPVPTRPGYMIGLGIMGVLILAMPLAYVGFIGAIVWGVYWSLTRGPGSSGGGIEAVGLFILSVIAGGFLIVLMLKPIFAPRARAGESVELRQFEELQLHSFVENVCAIVGAPAPKRIDIDCDINAAAGFRGGMLSIFKRGDVCLTIGLPLVAGMSKRQFAGILAHELGHFAQGAGMRSTYVVRSMIEWVARAAFERDRWDEALDEAAEESVSGWVTVGVRLCKLLIWCGRLPIKALALVFISPCAFMLKQMEYDADRYEVQFAGSASFENSCDRLGELGAATWRAHGEWVASFNRSSELPNNLPAVIGAISRRLSPEDRAEAKAAMRKQKSTLLATHPSHTSRIKAAKALDQPGLYTDEAPARTLFGDFDAACRKATIAHFEGMLGPYFVDAKFRATSALSAAGEKDAERGAILPRYLGYEPPTWRPVFVSLESVPNVEDGKVLVDRLRRARQGLKERAPAARAKVEDYRTAAEESAKWEQARTALDAGIAVNFKHLGLQSVGRNGVSMKIELLGGQAADAAGVIDEAGEFAMARLNASLSLLGVRSIERHISDARDIRTRADVLLRAMRAIRDTLPMARAVRHAVACTRIAGSTVKNQKTMEEAKKLVRPLSDEIRNRLDDARRLAGGTPDPYAGTASAAAYSTQSEAANLGETLVGASPGWRELDEIIEAGDLFVGRWAEMYRRVLGELVEMGENVEKSLSAAKSPGAPVAADAPDDSVARR